MKELSGEQFQAFYVFVALLIAALSLFPLLPINGDVLGCGQITQARYLVAMMALLTVGTAGAAIQTQWQVGEQIACRSRCKRYPPDSADEPISGGLHLVVIAIYREPIDLIILTIRSLADQPEANRIALAVGIEADAPSLELTTSSIRDLFEHLFGHFYIFVHPRGLPGEIAGKCSNLNYAARAAVAALEAGSVDLRGATFTSCDADNIFGRNYFSALDARLASRRHDLDALMWQAPLVYTWSTGASPFYVAITGALRSSWIAGILVPLSINGMSVFSLSLDLYRRAGYTSPIYQMEDILSTMRWSLVIGKRIKIECLPTVILSGPTSGGSGWESFDEWRRQIRRWSFGALEVFAYAFYHVRSSSLPVLKALPWLLSYFLYYFILQCVAPLSVGLGLLRGFLPGSHFFDVSPLGAPVSLGWVTVAWLLSLVAVMALLARGVVLLDRAMELSEGEDEIVWLGRLLPLPIVLLLHALVVLEALLSLARRGKSVCGHSPSAKEFLQTEAHRLPVRFGS